MRLSPLDPLDDDASSPLGWRLLGSVLVEMSVQGAEPAWVVHTKKGKPAGQRGQGWERLSGSSAGKRANSPLDPARCQLMTAAPSDAHARVRS